MLHDQLLHVLVAGGVRELTPGDLCEEGMVNI